MTYSSLLIANRGEIAMRVARAARDLGLHCVTVHSRDDAASLHTRIGDASHALDGSGPRAYLDIDAIIDAARTNGCEAIHPGYGFLSERADFAERCAAAGLVFVGPRVEHLALFGDKAAARRAAAAADVQVLHGTDHAVELDEARRFLTSLGEGATMIIKALAGGGGRGSRVVTAPGELEAAYDRCRSEAQASFGVDTVFVEEFLPRARHIEVQIVGDRHGAVAHLGERECSVQRRFQKLVEIAPAPALDGALRTQLHDAALRFARSVGYENLGTFEFLLDVADPGAPRIVFIETNARLQVEHTVTEAVTGVDLVQTQLRIAAGATLAEVGLADPAVAVPRGFAIQARVNMESIDANGNVRPGAGTLTAYEAPGGPGVRTDGFGYTGFRPSTSFDSLLAKVIGHSPSPDPAGAAARTARALSEFRLEGITTNIALLQNILGHPDLVSGAAHTRWLDENLATLAAAPTDVPSRFVPVASAKATDGRAAGFAGARLDTRDPLALFDHDTKMKAEQAQQATESCDDEAELLAPDGSVGLAAPIQGTLISVDVAVGDTVRKGQQVAVVEAMKMEHVIAADRDGIVRAVTMTVGDVVREGYPLVFVEEAEVAGDAIARHEVIDPDHIRADLQENIDRHAYGLDENRAAAVEKRHALGYRTVRESISQLIDDDSFKEYWPLIVARQHRRNTSEELRRNTPADGVVAGIGSINGKWFDDERSRAMVVAYDYTVLAGTQGGRNHYKQDRLFELAHRFRLPVVLFGEGGGGRPGDDSTGPAVAFDTHTFTRFAQLSGLVPLIAIVNGRTFAGNTALVACSDVIIATKGTTLGMGGPAMIEGGGLGVYTPEEVGPMSFQVPNGVVDILCEDEVEAVEVAKKYLSYFQGPIAEWEAHDQRPLRHAVPENRLRLYDMREVLHRIADVDSVLELRPRFGIGVITAFIRIEGRPVGVIANNPHHLAGAIDSPGADKAARFVQLCDGFDIPILSLMDCPGMMVGPDVERTALVRHCTRLFNAGANLTTPMFGVVVRKAYGLGVQAMCGASALVPFFTVAWPTAEFAGMNVEGSVKLGYRKELAAIEDPVQRLAEFDERVARAYEAAKAVNAAAGGGIDDVIDPAETRSWIVSGLRSMPPTPLRTTKKYPYIDTW